MPETFPRRVKIVEVGPRDGLQNEAVFVATENKIALIERLIAAGVGYVEAAAFVSPKWVPQMADATEVLRGVAHRDGVTLAALVPNLKGLDAAMAAGCKEVAVFAAASETFSQKNINCSIAESIARFEPVIAQAKAHDIKVRGYVSCVLGCPFEGFVAPEQVAHVATALYASGCYEISLGDTIGAGTPTHTKEMIAACARSVPLTALAGHFHDTWGMAIANIYAALQCGVATFDSSVSGVGGCPYSPGATGNVATEDVVYLCHALGIETGIDLQKLVETGAFISAVLGRSSVSRVANATQGQLKRLTSETA